MNRRRCSPRNWSELPMKITICDLRFAIQQAKPRVNRQSQIKNWKRSSSPTTARRHWKLRSNWPTSSRGARAVSRWGERLREPLIRNFFPLKARITATQWARFRLATLIYSTKPIPACFSRPTKSCRRIATDVRSTARNRSAPARGNIANAIGSASARWSKHSPAKRKNRVLTPPLSLSRRCKARRGLSRSRKHG